VYARLAVDVDGFVHDTAVQARHDERRSAWLATRGVTVLRVTAADVLQQERLEGVLVAIERAAVPPPARNARHLPRKTGEEPNYRAQ